jgi:Glycosyl hydrolase-like 10
MNWAMIFVKRMVLGALAVAVLLCWSTLAAEAGKSMGELRREAAHRQRRIIYNNDGGDATVYCKEQSIQAFLDCRTSHLAGTQCDTVFYCTSRGSFGLFTHPTEVGEVFTTREDRYGDNITGWLIEQGTDPLKLVLEFGHKNGIEVFWSMRMNDTHDSWGYTWEDLTTSQIKKDHPEWLVASKENKSRIGGFKAADFTHPEIRDYTFRFVEEVCRNYDVDGVELDYFRHPVFFKRHAWGQDVTDEERGMMTAMMRRIRAIADARGAERGRPILIAIRCPDSVDYCRAIGLDIEQWMKEGLVDLMTVTGYFRLNPWETSVELGHKYDVPVYACLSETRFKQPDIKAPRSSDGGYRGRALQAWNAGVDGIYVFNFNAKSPLWNEVGDPAKLAGMNKVYTTGARGTKVINSWLVGGKRFLNRDPVSPDMPRALVPGERVEFELRTGETIPKGAPPTVTLQLHVKGDVEAGTVQARLNGRDLPVGKRNEAWLEYSVPQECVLKGSNNVSVAFVSAAAEKVVLDDALLWVRYE